MSDEPRTVDVVTISYRSTAYYLLRSPAGNRLLVDCGWPGTLGMMKHELRRKDIQPAEIGHILVTHYHPDHAGLVEEMKTLGATHLLVDLQLPYVSKLITYVKPGDGFTPIRTDDAVVVTAQASRALLLGLGIEGEIVPTPGHSPDSVSLVLDDGSAFTGDLQPEGQAAADDVDTRVSWARLRKLGVRRIYPAHGGRRLLA